MYYNVEYLFVLVTFDGDLGRTFWFSPDNSILNYDNNNTFHDILKNKTIMKKYNWDKIITERKINYSDADNAPIIRALSSVFGSLDIKKRIDENTIKIEFFFYAPTEISIKSIPCLVFKIKTPTDTYFLDKNYSLIDKATVASKIFNTDRANMKDIIWEDPELNYNTDTNSVYPSSNKNIVNVCEIFRKAEEKNPEVFKKVIRAGMFLDIENNNLTKEFNSDDITNISYILKNKTFEEFSKEFKRDWGSYFDEDGNEISYNIGWRHSHYRLNNNTSKFEEFLVKVFDYLVLLGIVKVYNHYDKENELLTPLGKYLVKHPEFFVSKFLNKQIDCMIKEYNKEKFTFNINPFIRNYYNAPKTIKTYYRMFIEFYINKYVKPDIEAGIDVCKKYGITSNNLSKIVLDVIK